MGKKTNLIVGAVATVAATSLLVGCNFYGKEYYTVTFNTNGGNPIAPVKAQWEDQVKLPNPTREGHKFVGWYYDAGLTNKISDDIIIEGDITVYAKWEIQQYSVSFESNGGSEVETQKANYGTELEISNPTRKSYEFVGWYLDEEFEVEYDGKVHGNDITVYAKWKECVTEVTFDINGTEVNGVMEKITLKITDESLALPKSNYSRTGYSFKGWSTTENGVVEFEDGADASKLVETSQKVTLYAVWEAKEYNLHFVSEGLQYGQDIKIKFTEKLVLPSANPTKVGHTFVGWALYGLTSDTKFVANKKYYTYNSVSKVYTQAEVAVGGDVTADTYFEASIKSTTDTMPAGNLTLNAVWSVNDYVITFNSKGGSEVSSITASYGASITLPTDVTKIGHTFKGWYTDEACTTRFEGNTMPLNGATLYAKWDVNSYTIRFISSQENDYQIGTQTFNYGETKALTPNVHERVGYNFVGWATEANGDVVYQDGDPITMGAKNVALYAVWEARTDTKYSVYHILMPLSGAPNASSIKEVENLQGTTDELTSAEAKSYTGFKTPTITQEKVKADGTTVIYVIYEREEYTVTFVDENGNPIENSEVKIKYEGTISSFPANEKLGTHSLSWVVYEGSDEYDASTQVKGNVTLQAVYTQITSAITLMDGSSQLKVISDVGAGNSIVDLLKVNEPSKEGYDFKGWYKDEKLSQPLTDTVMPDENLVLYAKFELKDVTITFVTEYGSVTSITQKYTSEVTLPSLSQEGYTFGGWYLDLNDDLTKQDYTTMPSSDKTLYAKWTVNKYTISFDTGFDGLVVNAITDDYGKKIVELNGFQTGLEKEGYSFLYWKLNEVRVDGNTTIPAENVTLVAVWEKVNYEYNFKVGSETKTLDLKYGDKVVIPDFTKQDEYPISYKFDGWYTSETYETKAEVDETAFIANGTSITYYGRYVEESYVIQFRNGNDAIIWETSSTGDVRDDLTNAQSLFYGYVQSLYYKTNAYDVIYDALSNAINNDNNALTYVKIYLTCFTKNTSIPVSTDLSVPFNSLDEITQAGVLVNQGPTYGVTLEETNAQNLAYTVASALHGAFDLSNADDVAYITKVLEAVDQSTITVATDATSNLRSIAASEYTKYKGNAYCPVNEGYIFNGWKIEIDTVNNIKIVDATWVKKLDTPIYLRVQSIGKSSVVYAWNEVEGASSYMVTYTIKDSEGVIVSENLMATTSNLMYKIEGLENGQTVELKVKANNPAGSMSKEHILPEDVIVGTDVTTSIASTQIDSDYTDVLSYEHVVVSPSDISAVGNYFYLDRANNTFYFFENTTYEFNNVSNIEIIENGTLASYVNGELVVGTVTGDNHFTFVTTNIDNEEVEYKAIVQPKINAIGLGSNLSSYSDVKAGKSSYRNQNDIKYLIGAASTEEANNHNGYLYELEENTYYNGFKFDISVLSASGDKYSVEEFTPEQFQLAYTFYDSSNNVVDPSELYVRDVENDVFYFLKNEGTYKAVITYKADGYYETVDKTPVADKTYYTLEGTNYIEANVGNVFTTGVIYYEYFVGVGLPNKTKTDKNTLSNFQQEFTFVLNDSINVFDNESLKKAYADPNVGSVTIHANIDAKLATNQVIYEDYLKTKYSTDDVEWSTLDGNVDIKEGTAVFSNEEGLGLKIWSKGDASSINAIKASDGSYYYYSGEGSTYSLVDAEWVNNFVDGSFVIINEDIKWEDGSYAEYGFDTASIYQRDSNNVQGGIVVNGNYFTINGSDLPYVKSDESAAKTGAYKIQNGRASFFETIVGDSTFNNLTIVGNTQNSSANLGGSTGSSLSMEEYMERTSGGFNGVRIYNSQKETVADVTMTVNNVNISNTLIALYCGTEASITANYANVNDSWSNSLFAYGSNNVTVTNSKLVNSGGAALHITDVDRADSNTTNDGNYDNPNLFIDLASEIDNFVSGEEPWFKQHSMEVAALNMKSSLEAAANGAGCTIISKVKDPVTGLESEKMNLVYINMSEGDATKSDTAPEDAGINLTVTPSEGCIFYADTSIKDTYGIVFYFEMDMSTGSPVSTGRQFLELTTDVVGYPIKVFVEMYPKA